jgi:hypothetical protein
VRARTLPADVVKVIQRTVQAAQGEPDPVRAARWLTRGTTIVGLMIEDLEETLPTRLGRWVTRVSWVAWGIVELAAPRSLGEVLFQYWVWLIYALALAMIVIGVVTDAAGVARVGATVGAIALVAHGLILALRRYMTGQAWFVGFWLPVVLATSVAGVYLNQAMAATGVAGRIAELRTVENANEVKAQVAAEISRAEGRPSADAMNEARARFATYLVYDDLFIPCYTAWFVAIALALGYASRRFMARPHAAISLVAAGALATAAADLIENTRAWMLLGLGSIQLPYTTSLKWNFLIVTVVLIALLAVTAAWDWLGVLTREARHKVATRGSRRAAAAIRPGP